RHREAVEKTGCRPGTTEPIVVLALRHEEDVGLKQAAAELDQSTEELTRKLEQLRALTPGLDPLRKGGTVKRGVFLEAFHLLVRGERVGPLVLLPVPLAPTPELLLPVAVLARMPLPEPLLPLLPTLREALLPERLKVTEETDHLVFDFSQQLGQAQVVAL